MDRVEDITDVSLLRREPTCDRTVSLFGYVRGTHLKASTRVHLIGAGDFDIEEMTALEDPCPFPNQKDRKSLHTKDSLLYAPFANIGRVQTDKDGMYIDIKDVHYTKDEYLDVTDQNKAETVTARLSAYLHFCY